MGWKRAFGGAFKGTGGGVFEIPGFIIDLVDHNVIKDFSHHHDASPSFGFDHPDSETEVRLWVDHPMESLRETGGTRFVVSTGGLGGPDNSWEFDELEAALEKLFEEIADARDKAEPNPQDPEKWADPNYYLKTLQEKYWSAQ